MMARDIEGFPDCERYHLIRHITSDYDRRLNIDIIKNETEASDYDLESAKRDFGYKDYKWATVKAYYSMLHEANAFLRSKNILIKHHRCIYYQLERCAKKGEINPRFVIAFKATLDDRMEANYYQKYDENTASETLTVAGEFNKGIKELIRP
jgi:uncharacterized protein (UPF0332 family)